MNKVSPYKAGLSSNFLVGASGLLLFTLAPLCAQELPTNPVVTQGGIAIQQTTPNITTITQSTEKAVINWNNFSIGSGNTVQFIQPGSSSIAVNRVTGGGVSQIDGNLLANGQVWILNPNGLLIGAGGQINTAGFLGTTAGLSDTDFMAGNYRFSNLSLRGALLNNKGAIVSTVGGYAVLAGQQVSNEGLIQANLGSVVLGGARSYALDVVGDKLLSFTVTSPLELATLNGKAVLENTGTLQADGGRVQMTARMAKDVIGGVINTTGLVQANNVALVNGTIVLDAGETGAVNIGGTISANNSAGAGGNVSITGGSIVNSGTLMANGFDGGSINLFASQRIDSTGNLSANAGLNGQGGEVMMITDLNNKSGVTAVSGSITAQGGSVSGNGGFVETSASILNIGSGLRVNTSALRGKSGTWLLDPINVEIIPGGPNTSPIVSASTIGADTIMHNLNTTDVTIVTDSSGSDVGNITISSPIAWSTNALTLMAQNNIIINANLNATESAALNYRYGLATAAGTGSAVKVASGVKVEISDPNNFTWQKGNSGNIKKLVLENAFLRFGDGVNSSITEGGNLSQPHYFDSVASPSFCLDQWCKLTFSNLPFSYAFGVGGSGSGSWNTNGLIFIGGDVFKASAIGDPINPPSGSVTVESTVTNTNFTSQPLLNVNGSIDISRYNEGTGSITASVSIPASTLGLSGTDFKISNTYTLDTQARFIKTESKISAGSAPLENIRMWAVNPDDFFGGQDATFKIRGNLSNTGFTQITASTDSANAVLVTDDPSSATALIFSNASGINSLVGPITTALGGTVFDMVGIDTATSPIQKTGNLDGYGLFATRGNLAANTSTSVVTFFGAAPNASLSSLKDQLIAAADLSTSNTTNSTISTADLNNLLAGIKPPPQTALPPPIAPTNAPVAVTNAPDPAGGSKPPPQNSALDIDEPPPPPQNSSEPAPAPNNEPAPPPPGPNNEPAAAPPTDAQPPSGPAGAPPPVGSAAPPPADTAGSKSPAPAPAPISAPVTPATAASTPVAPPPPSPVSDVKPPTPKDAADTGDKTLAAAAPPPPPAAASQPKRSTAPSNTVKVGSVSVEAVAQANVPAAAGEQRFSLSGNSATW